MNYLFTDASDAQSVKQELISRGLLAHGPVLHENGRIGFPVTGGMHGYELVSREVEVPGRKSLREALYDRIGARSQEVKRAFDVIGDIAIIESSKGHEDIEREIAESLLEVHRNIASVYVKRGGHEGDYRIQSYRWLAGEKRTTTSHRENGYTVELDIASTYFSPRLAGERMRIAGLVEEGERVLILGSGVGPYPVCIEKHSHASMIVGVEFNEEAHSWAHKTVTKNKCARIELVCTDAHGYLSESNERFDRIVLPLPAQSAELIEPALKALVAGGSLHVYLFTEESSKQRPLAETYGCAVEHIETVGAAAPGYYRVCVDLRAPRE